MFNWSLFSVMRAGNGFERTGPFNTKGYSPNSVDSMPGVVEVPDWRTHAQRGVKVSFPLPLTFVD